MGSRLAESSAIYSHMSQELKLPRVVKKNQRFQNNNSKYTKLKVKTDWVVPQKSSSPPPPMAAMAFSVDLDTSGNYMAHVVGNAESAPRMVTPTRLAAQFRSTQTSRHLP